MNPAPFNSGEKSSQREVASPGMLSRHVEHDGLKVTAIEVLHGLLVSRYIDVIDLISRPGLLPYDPPSTRRGARFYNLLSKLERARTVHENAWRRRPITRTLVESHIKRSYKSYRRSMHKSSNRFPLMDKTVHS